jgi:hypothetical protein
MMLFSCSFIRRFCRESACRDIFVNMNIVFFPESAYGHIFPKLYMVHHGAFSNTVYGVKFSRIRIWCKLSQIGTWCHFRDGYVFIYRPMFYICSHIQQCIYLRVLRRNFGAILCAKFNCVECGHMNIWKFTNFPKLTIFVFQK